MSGASDILHRRRFRDGYLLQWIKKLDRHLKFLLEELAHVRHTSAAAAKETTGRAISLLWSAVMRNRAHQFCMQPRHGAPRDFRYPNDIRVGRFGVSAAQTDKTIAFLARFCCGK